MNTFHTERKVPGGKLVVVDGELTDGVITDAQVSGDFFLEPEEAYFALAPALVGVSTADSREEITDRLDKAVTQAAAEVGAQVDLQGFSTADVAFAVRRGLTGATDFWDHEWEIFHDESRPTVENVALDQVLLEEVAAGRRKPTVRFWEWDDTAVVIGSFQSYSNEVEPEGVSRYDVQVVRRVSGGGAMFMEGGNCVTFSIYAPDSLVAGLSYEESYSFMDQFILDALTQLGVRATYEPINDIVSQHGKIGGAAQKRVSAGAVLHHDTLSYDIDANKMVEILRIGKAKISDKGVASAKKRVDPLRSQTGVSREHVIHTMIDTFTRRTGASSGIVTAQELERARELIDKKFGTEEWTKRVP